eukprot:SAG25_NODE_719_length_5744_cov_4.938884_2_plen_171_part_00
MSDPHSLSHTQTEREREREREREGGRESLRGLQPAPPTIYRGIAQGSGSRTRSSSVCAVSRCCAASAAAAVAALSFCAVAAASVRMRSRAVIRGAGARPQRQPPRSTHPTSAVVRSQLGSTGNACALNLSMRCRGRSVGVSIFLDENRRYIGKSQSKTHPQRCSAAASAG